MDDSLEYAVRLAKVAVQNNPTFSIVDAKRGYARSPTAEEKLLAKYLLFLYNLNEYKNSYKNSI